MSVLVGHLAQVRSQSNDPLRIDGSQGASEQLGGLDDLAAHHPGRLPGFIGFGGGLFSVGLLTATMNLASGGMSGILLGTWGGVQATAAGLAVAFSGSLRDTMSALAQKGSLGPALEGVSTGYVFVYLIEIALLFATLIAVGPLVGAGTKRRSLHPASHLESVTRTDGLKEA